MSAPTLYVADDGTIIGRQLNFYEDVHRRTLAPEDREVEWSECEWALEQARADGGIFNGCISYYLTRRYGDRLRHVESVGWVVREAAR
jgi:hypothetical protein